MDTYLLFKQRCQEILGTDIRSATPVAGGDIHQAFRLTTDKGHYFLKANAAPTAANMFETEAAGLDLLAATKALRTPTVFGFGSTSTGGFLLLEFIESARHSQGFWEKFGSGLAALHRSTAPSFGLTHDNFIGTLPQSNRQHDTWPDFYIHERLMPQLEIAKRQNHLQSADFQSFDHLFEHLPVLCPTEPPALVHGDLWSGNFLCDTSNQPVLIDPAACYAHREMDLAMSRLFGGFDRSFYRSYEEAWPLEPGFEQRLPIYQLYYLLVHVNLFGGGYVRAVREALRTIV